MPPNMPQAQRYIHPYDHKSQLRAGSVSLFDNDDKSHVMQQAQEKPQPKKKGGQILLCQATDL